MKANGTTVRCCERGHGTQQWHLGALPRPAPLLHQVKGQASPSLLLHSLSLCTILALCPAPLSSP